MSKNCNIRKGDDNWPQENDESGDSMFLVDNNSLIQQIRSVKNKKKRDLFLSNMDDLDNEEEKINIKAIEEKVDPEIKIDYDNMDKKEKIAYILEKLKNLKNQDT